MARYNLLLCTTARYKVYNVLHRTIGYYKVPQRTTTYCNLRQCTTTYFSALHALQCTCTKRFSDEKLQCEKQTYTCKTYNSSSASSKHHACHANSQLQDISQSPDVPCTYVEETHMYSKYTITAAQSHTRKTPDCHPMFHLHCEEHAQEKYIHSKYHACKTHVSSPGNSLNPPLYCNDSSQQNQPTKQERMEHISARIQNPFTGFLPSKFVPRYSFSGPTLTISAQGHGTCTQSNTPATQNGCKLSKEQFEPSTSLQRPSATLRGCPHPSAEPTY